MRLGLRFDLRLAAKRGVSVLDAGPLQFGDADRAAGFRPAAVAASHG